MKNSRSIDLIYKVKDVDKISKVISSVASIVTTKLNTNNNHISTLSSIFLVFLKSIPAVYSVVLPNTKLNNSTKMILSFIGTNNENNEFDFKILDKSENIISHKIKTTLDSLSFKTIMQSKYIFSNISEKDFAIERKIYIEKMAIKKYKTLPLKEQDVPEHLVKLYAKKFAKFCYMVGFKGTI